MRTPVKLNRAGWPSWVYGFLPNMDDPRGLCTADSLIDPELFSRMVSTIKVGPAWRTTQARRHGQADERIRTLLAGSKPVILDVGASDGATSLDLIRRLGSGFKRYYVTDKDLEVRTLVHRDCLYFFGPGGEALMVATPRFVAYADRDESDPISRNMVSRLLNRLPKGQKPKLLSVSLLQPELMELIRRDRRVEVRNFDILAPWQGPEVDFVKAANVLNPGYFTTEQLKRAVSHLYGALVPSGRLLIVDNDPEERFVIFRKGPKGPELELAWGGEVRAAKVVRQMAEAA